MSLHALTPPVTLAAVLLHAALGCGTHHAHGCDAHAATQGACPPGPDAAHVHAGHDHGHVDHGCAAHGHVDHGCGEEEEDCGGDPYRPPAGDCGGADCTFPAPAGGPAVSGVAGPAWVGVRSKTTARVAGSGRSGERDFERRTRPGDSPGPLRTRAFRL